MRGPRLRVLWICGAPGAGKSVAAWALFEELAAAGQGVAYVDIDQLGMLYPAAADDPERHLFKAEALTALLPGYVAAGARCLVVSGVVDARSGPGTALLGDVDLAVCLLSPDPAVLHERILDRGWDQAAADEAVAENALLRTAAFVDLGIDTTGLSVADTVARLRALIGEDGRSSVAPGPVVCSPAELGVVVVTGPRAVGSSTIGFGLARRRWRAGRRTGFVDLQQLGFICDRDGRPTTDANLAIDQLAVAHNVIGQRGAELLVVSGHLAVSDRAVLRAALPAARVSVVRLRADAKTLRDHVHTRARGSEARLAGDDLLGADQTQQDDVVGTALAQQDLLDAATTDDEAVLDVSGRTLTDVITDLEALSREWPTRTARRTARPTLPS